MQIKKGNILVAALCLFTSLFSVVYVSCTKVGDNPACDGVTCLNDGYCKNGTCVCAVGFEGKNCGTASIQKYIGTWDATQTVIESDHNGTVGSTKSYTVFFKPTATPTTFFINNFLGKPEYNQILAVLDATNSFSFYLDTTRPVQMWFDQVIINQPSTGLYYSNNRTVSLYVSLRYLNSTFNWQVDKLKIDLTPHNF